MYMSNRIELEKCYELNDEDEIRIMKKIKEENFSLVR